MNIYYCFAYNSIHISLYTQETHAYTYTHSYIFVTKLAPTHFMWSSPYGYDCILLTIV